MLLSGIAGAQIAAQSQFSDAAAQNNEAVRLIAEGRAGEAEKLYRAALDNGSNDDLSRAKIGNNLAGLYLRQDRYSDAEQMYRSVLEWRQKNLPASSIEVAYSLNNLGEVYRSEGRDWEARNLMETAVRSLQHFHPDAPGLPSIESNLAIAIGRFGELDKAEILLHEALIAFARQGNDGREYAITLGNLAQVLQTKNELAAAADAYEQAIGIFERLGPAVRTDLAATLANAGILCQRMDRVDEGRYAEQRALDLLNPTGDALLRAQILRNLGNITANAGKPADSLPYFEQSLGIQERTLGVDHPATAGLLLDYSSATRRAGNKSLARKLRKRATELLARLTSQAPQQLTVSVRDLLAAK
jgi:tetratricopeptide (TPR) repeat protein